MKQSFPDKVLNWGKKHGRKHLPWQHQITAYRVWVSEIMLQQTQVETVIPYYKRFINKFPDVEALAQADIDEVLHLWSGLGYYARARNLYKTAQIVASDYKGVFPSAVDQLEKLPGIGRSTAGAILSLSQKQFAVILDGNVKRVLARCYAIEGWPGNTKVQKQLWHLAESLTPEKDTALYNQSMMDIGSTVCTRTKPSCQICPLEDACVANQNGSQSLYPGKKPKKNLPVRTTRMLMILNKQEELLLEQRPPTGIWGGLWGLPELEPEIEPEIEQEIKPDKSIDLITRLPVRRHTFSHFHLDIHPLVCQARSHAADQVNDRQTKWYDLENPVELGLAAPVAKLVNELKAYLQEKKGVSNS